MENDMKDLRIVIVSWNVSDVLKRCLESLPQACAGLDWDCVVVDNASTDGTLEAIGAMVKGHPGMDIIANQKNFGFAYACNQGASNHKARYVLLLNPDTDCPAGSLASLVRAADERPEVGIMGPKLVYPDGRYQPSAQRFPGIADQMLILLKLHHIFPHALALQRYFMHGMEHDKAQEVDQVMGACFLVRGRCWDQMHGLDQRYFIWFEEVDACKQAKANGWKVMYEPSVHVIHHEGQAFAKVFSWKRQGYFNDSLKKYMRKWHGILGWLVVSALAPISMVMAGILTPLNIRPKTRKLVRDAESGQGQAIGIKPVAIWILGALIFEAFSFLTNGNGLEQGIVTVIAALGMAWFGYRSPALALSLAAGELMIGGFGYLFGLQADFLVRGISLRMAIMAGFFMGWGLNALKVRIWRYWKFKELILVQVWVFVLGILLMGIVRGLILKQPYLYQDLNAWLFLFYFIPVLDISHRYPNELRRYVTVTALSAVAWLALKLMAVFYAFTHGISGTGALYAWIRDTRVGEITPIGGSAYRIFFQSMVYAAMALPLLGAWAFAYSKEITSRQKWIGFAYGVACLSIVALSLSRSLWVGVFAAFVTVAILALKMFSKNKPFLKKYFVRFGWFALAGLGAITLIVSVWEVPLPRPIQGSVMDLFASRASVSDPASSSRWQLLPAMIEGIKKEPIIGHGFGSTVTYRTQDPRALAQSEDGMYTTYAMEWGWLAFFYKFGIFGFVIMLWLIVSLAWRVWKSGYPWWIRAGLVGATICISVVHIFTPYLDHPLGFGWILGMEGMLAIKREEEHPAYVWRQ